MKSLTLREAAGQVYWGLPLFQQFGAFTGVCGQISSMARKLMGSAFYSYLC